MDYEGRNLDFHESYCIIYRVDLDLSTCNAGATDRRTDVGESGSKSRYIIMGKPHTVHIV